jgi:RNA polymerase sigma-B factor
MTHPRPATISRLREPDAVTQRLLEEYSRTHDPRLRSELVDRFDGVVQWVVNRASRDPQASEDLAQVARIGLVQALERYEPRRRVKFISYAVKVMTGKIHHYFRDCSGMIRAPRLLQQLHSSLSRLEGEAQSRFGRAGTDAEIAGLAGVTEFEVREARLVGGALRVQSLDDLQPGSLGLGDQLGALDARLESLVEYGPLRDALGRLDQRKQVLFRHRFFALWTQAQVATLLGISQMHVSRLERAGLRELRAHLQPAGPPDPDGR